MVQDYHRSMVDGEPAEATVELVAVEDRAQVPVRYVELATLIVAIAVVAAVVSNLLVAPGDVGQSGPAVSPSTSATLRPSPSPMPANVVPGLPPEGATPSTPERGELILRLEGSTKGQWNMIWVYADGRLIWHRSGYRPEDASEASTGLLEQRLTPEGVELLRSEIISTGLFERDLALASDGNPPYLEIQVRNGDRLVRATWAWRRNMGPGRPARAPTPEQASALERLHALLTDPASWPGTAWEEREIKEYVPSTYSICFRGIPQPIEPSRVLTMLPGSAQDLLRAGIRTQEEAMPSNEGCYGVSTEDARALSQILDDAGITRYRSSMGEPWLRYSLEDPGPGNQVWITVGPVLPHGEATWLGPG